jgi:hypothetical protein
MIVTYREILRPYGNGYFLIEGCKVVASEGCGCFTLRTSGGSLIKRVNGADCVPPIPPDFNPTGASL